MKDPLLNQRLAHGQAKTIELLWKHDLLSPPKAGKCFTRNGLRVEITQKNLDLVHSLLARGANDVRFVARRVEGFSAADAHFVLDSCEIVSASAP